MRQKYNLAPNDPRCLALTSDQCAIEIFADDYYHDKSNETYETEGIDVDELIANAADWDEVIDFTNLSKKK